MKRIFCIFSLLLPCLLLLCPQAGAISARHAIVLDAATGTVLCAQNESDRCLIASTTKIMTGLLVCESDDLDRTVDIPPEATGIEGSSLYLKPGETLRVEDLLYGMMLRSGNDAAAALAIAHSGSIEGFVQRMNERAEELGLHDTHFANPHGLDDEGNYSTCADLARLAAKAMENETFARIVGTKNYRFGTRALMNHNKLLWRYEGAEGVKTGFTRAAGRILVSSAMREGRRLICVTIDAPDDWNDHCTLLDEAFSRFTPCTLCRRGQVMGRNAAAAQEVRVGLLADERIDLVRVRVAQGRGEAEFCSNGCVLARCPLEPIQTGEPDGRAHPEDHCLARHRVPAECRGADRRWPRARQRQYGPAW